MIIIDITKDYLELLNAKKDIENKLIQANIIEKEFTISEFINYINFSSHIYWVSESEIYPFKIIDKYIFVVADAQHKNIEPLINALTDINFDFSKLTHKTKYEISANNLIEKPHFIINKELYYNIK